jgi:outer membrane protein
LLREELRAARDRFEVGEVTRTDVSLAEAALAAARSDLAAAKGALQSARESYRVAVGRYPGRLSAPPHLPAIERNLKRAQQIAVRNHPRMRQAQHQVTATELAIAAAEADMLPVVSLNGRLSVTENFGSRSPVNSEGETLSVGVGAEQTIYAGGRLSSAARLAMANRDDARNNLHVVRHDIFAAVGNAYADLQSASAQIVASDERIRAARVAFDGVREEAKLGARTTLDVLDAEQQLLDARAARVNAQASQYIAAYGVLSSMGLLTAEHLKLPVQIYDPSAYYELVKDGVAKRSKQGKQLDRVLKALNK